MDNKLKIILYLAKKNEMFTLHELSKLVNIPYTSLYRAVKEMNDITTILKKGKSKLIQINWNEITKSYLTIASHNENKRFVEKLPLIKKIEEKINGIVLIFGSYAKRTHTKLSDIDIMVINKKGNRNFRFTDLESLYDLKINPIFFSEKEFILMLKDKEENVGKQALKNHVLLSGFSDFWRLVKNAI